MSKIVPLQSSKHDALQFVWSYGEGGNALVRGPMLTSKEQTDAWLEYVHALPHGKKRWVALQLAIPDTEWPVITTEHFFLEGNWTPHLVVPTPQISIRRPEEVRSDLQWKTIWKFVQQINCEGWLFFSEWLDDEIDLTLGHIYKDATEEFQVEAALKDFHHEVTSFLLRDYRVNCAKLVLQLGQKEENLDRQGAYEIETEIVRMHFEILRNLDIQRDVLVNIEHAIGRVEALHPELIPLKLKVHLLSTLIGPPLTWVQMSMLTGILCSQLGANIYIHCDSGFDRTNLGFAVQLAVKELLRCYPIEQVIAYAEALDGESPVGSKFKQLTWEFLAEVCTPLTQAQAAWSSWAPDEQKVNDLLSGHEKAS